MFSADLRVSNRAGHATIFKLRDNDNATMYSNRASRTSQGPEIIRKIVRPQCLDGVATTKIVKWQIQTTWWPENNVTLSRQNCRMPSSVFYNISFAYFLYDSTRVQIRHLQVHAYSMLTSSISIYTEPVSIGQMILKYVKNTISIFFKLKFSTGNFSYY